MTIRETAIAFHLDGLREEGLPIRRTDYSV